MKKYHSKDVLQVTTVELMVKDIEVSLHFYLEVLKMKLLSEENGIYSLGTTNNKTLIRLTENKQAHPKTRSTGLYHFALLLPERKHLGQLINHFIKLQQPITGGSDHGVSEALYLDDPDGNGIEIYTDKPDSVWEKENNEIKMVTLQLDYEDLVKNAFINQEEYDAGWKEMPAETVMGHVHFHVNNIENAKEFFVNTLGFQTTLNFHHTALFISDKQYHHHIGLNIWNGEDAINNPENTVGLKSYDVNMSEDKFNSVIEKLQQKNIDIISKNSYFASFKDVNDVTVNLIVAKKQ